MSKDQYLERLRQVPMFRSLNNRQLQTVARQADTISRGANHVVIKEGEPGEEFFVLLSGKVSITTGGREVAVLGEGDFFGELALFDRAPRDATITTTEPCELMVISARRFQPLLDDVPQLSHKIMVGLARRLREADKARPWQ